jgi:hypothetical protein
VVTILVQMEPRWILRDFDLAGILCPARNSTLYLRPTLVRATSGAIRSPSCLTLASRSALPLQPTCSPCLPHTQLPDAVYPVSVCSASPTPVERTLKRRLSAVLPIRNAPIRFRFEQVCSCDRSNLIPKDPVMPILIPNLILNLIPI